MKNMKLRNKQKLLKTEILIFTLIFIILTGVAKTVIIPTPFTSHKNEKDIEIKTFILNCLTRNEQECTTCLNNVIQIIKEYYLPEIEWRSFLGFILLIISVLILTLTITLFFISFKEDDDFPAGIFILGLIMFFVFTIGMIIFFQSMKTKTAIENCLKIFNNEITCNKTLIYQCLKNFK